MNWNQFTIAGKTYCCRHLRPMQFVARLEDNEIDIHITFSNHCFTDEKENGPRLFKEGRGRYWSQDRYDYSLELPKYLSEALDNNYYCVPHFSGQNEQYHYIESNDYAIFFNINKPQNTDNVLKLKVVSAYPIDSWGRESIPKGKPYRINYVLRERVNARSVLKKK